ncbi:MAG: Tim44/TimA family putative adaptor protein [Aestuariivita sp.]|nr:Tim44/TimA family putative adaptor protein [Aestuariivita sp.]
MNGNLIQILVLAGVALFLILKLRNVLGTREGFERPQVQRTQNTESARKFEVIENDDTDHDVLDHFEEGSNDANALLEMKLVDPSFSVNTFIQGARDAYEMIVMAFEAGDIEHVEGLISDEIHKIFSKVISDRHKKDLVIDAEFIGIREASIKSAEYNFKEKSAQITMRFVSELTSVVRKKEGEIVEGDPKEIKRQRDTWVFERFMNEENPNWILIATTT